MPALAGDLATLKQMTSLATLGIQAATPGGGLGGAVVEFTHDSVHREDDLETADKKRKFEKSRRKRQRDAARRIPALTKEFAC